MSIMSVIVESKWNLVKNKTVSMGPVIHILFVLLSNQCKKVGIERTPTSLQMKI